MEGHRPSAQEEIRGRPIGSALVSGALTRSQTIRRHWYAVHLKELTKAQLDARENKPAFEPLLDDTQTAKLLGDMHIKTLQRMARYGEIPAHKIGRRWFFRASELDAWLRASCVPASDAVNSAHRPCLVN